MNKLKNIGISVLAGTLVSLSAAQAGGVSVSGAWELSYTKLDHDEVTGHPLGIKKNISFGASGDMSDGGGVTWATNVGWSDAAGISSASMAINMGGIATLTYDSGGGGTGANAVDNIVPTAWEEIDYGFSTGISDVGAVSASKGVVTLGVKAPGSGTGLSVSYINKMGDDHTSDGATSGGGGNNSGVDVVLDIVDYDASQFGFRLGVAGQVELHDITCYRNNTAMADGQNSNVKASIGSCQDGVKHNPYAGSVFTRLQLGPLHLGTQATFRNLATTATTAIMNTRSVVGGAALVFGDTLSLSYGMARDKYRYNDRNRVRALDATVESVTCGSMRDCTDTGPDTNEYVTQQYSGWSAALNFGPVALKGTSNKVRSVGQGQSTGIYKLGDRHSEINLSIAF